MVTDFHFPVIKPLIIRHAEDAAFYWAQLDWTVASADVRFERVQHFNWLLTTHLNGLKVAGPTGRNISLTSLERWQKPGEAFCSVWLALQSSYTNIDDDVLKLICRHPDQLVRGAVSALAACSSDHFTKIAKHWSANNVAPAAQVIMLRAAALRNSIAVAQLDNPLPIYLQSKTSHVRAAACRACAVAGQPGNVIPLLREALSDPDLQVRAEASIALEKLGDMEAARPVLLQSVLAQATVYGGATGAIRAQASRRLQRWVRELAWLTPIGAPEARDLLALLPPRMALTFALWHGDLAHLPFVIDQLADEGVGRYAGWVWQTLTGIDLNANGLALPEPDPDPASLDPDQLITETRLDADSGHPQADQAAVRAATAASPHLVGRGKRVLLGREIDAKTALDLLENAPQAIRAMVAQMLNQAQSTVRINVRASTTEQRIAMNTLHDMFAPRAAA
ncbi:hypothetical protein F2P45_31080 [Massilia sp. CCM 8733]|uniref:HEAT repeat domain-containing protein n=1 Tax=Massilia mucilaginosa TaxID=2609282 RepID=A0ABX0P2W6_9BURK|nr:HEAT repeat domain-containing protein [Massilia mucilaginosa]NHZ93419.1 hypothetical protein [Massilia mucilaginosa]